MAHQAQAEFIHGILKKLGLLEAKNPKVIEIGSQNINGSVKDLFPESIDQNWIGFDIGEGKDVDFVIPGELIQIEDSWADLSISTECLEHTSSWKEIILNLIRCTKENGLIVLTFAGPERATHGTIDTSPKNSPFTPSYYKNLAPEEILKEIAIRKYFNSFAFQEDTVHNDTYFWGIRNERIEGSETLDTEQSLARARGQLAAVMIENKSLKKANNILQKANTKLEAIETKYKKLRLAHEMLKKAHKNKKAKFKEIQNAQTKNPKWSFKRIFRSK